jgi:hypothetical protein
MQKLGIVGILCEAGPVKGRILFDVYWFRDDNIPFCAELVNAWILHESYALMMRITGTQVEGPHQMEFAEC